MEVLQANKNATAFEVLKRMQRDITAVDRAPMAAALEPLLTTSQTAKLTQRSAASLRRDRVRGVGIPYIKLQTQVRYCPSDIQAYVDENRQACNAQRSLCPKNLKLRRSCR
jgi:hypothetical protein